MSVVRFLPPVLTDAVRTHLVATDVCVIQGINFRTMHAQVKYSFKHLYCPSGL